MLAFHLLGVADLDLIAEFQHDVDMFHRVSCGVARTAKGATLLCSGGLLPALQDFDNPPRSREFAESNRASVGI